MESLNAKFDEIISEKKKVLEALALTKSEKRKMTSPIKDNADIGYFAKNTLSKIALEQDRKLKSSKAYKKNQEYVSSTT